MTDSDHPDLMDPVVQQCPYALYKALRASAPLYKMPSTGFRLVTNYALAREVIRAPDQYLSSVSPMALSDDGIPQEIIDIYETGGWLPLASCSTSDAPQHPRVRGFLEKLFTAERVRAVTPTIDAIAESLLDELADQSEVEFVQDFAHPLPMMVIAALLGVPQADIAQFKIWSDAIVEPFSMMASPERRIECARLVVEMQSYFADMVADRQKNPGEDLISEAIAYRDAAGEPFTMQELMTIITIDLLASGNETTTAAIGSGMKLLIENPDVVADITTDAGADTQLCRGSAAAGVTSTGDVQAVRCGIHAGGRDAARGRPAQYSLRCRQPGRGAIPEPRRYRSAPHQTRKSSGLRHGSSRLRRCRTRSTRNRQCFQGNLPSL